MINLDLILIEILPLNTIIEFHSLLINVSYVIEKDNECYPEIYLDECLYIKDNL